MQNSQLLLQHHVCLHAAMFPALMNWTYELDGLNLWNCKHPQLNVYKSCIRGRRISEFEVSLVLWVPGKPGLYIETLSLKTKKKKKEKEKKKLSWSWCLFSAIKPKLRQIMWGSDNGWRKTPESNSIQRQRVFILQKQPACSSQPFLQMVTPDKDAQAFLQGTRGTLE